MSLLLIIVAIAIFWILVLLILKPNVIILVFNIITCNVKNSCRVGYHDMYRYCSGFT